MKINFRQGVVSHQETGFLEPNGSGGVRIAASIRSATVTLAHRDTNYTHSEDNNVEAAWPGPFPAGQNYYLYWDFDQLTYLRTFGYTTLEPVAQSKPPGSGNSVIIAAVPGVASPVAFGSFEVEGHYVLPTGKTFAVVGSTGSPNNDGVYTVQSSSYDLVTGNTTILVNEAVATAAVSGELTLDIDSTGQPLFKTGRHWYDTANNVHYVLDINNAWIEVLRVFAANLFNGTTFISMSQTGDFTGTQIGDNSTVASGRVLFGDAGNPIRRDDNTFFTTEDQFFTNQSRVDAIRLESNVSRAQATSSSLAQFGIVAWRSDGKIESATYDDTGNTVVGVLTESILVGQVGAVITQGTVTNPAWNWTSTLSVGSKLWIQNGELVGIDPNLSDPITYSTKQVPVARVLSVDTIIFEQGLGGVGPQGPIGISADLIPATTSTMGGVFLSDPATNPLVPIAVGENHPVIIGGPYAATNHTHTALQISFTPGNNISATDTQNAIAELAIEKLNLSGGTMTGILTLSTTPTADFHAATKQYVDSLFQGLDAKEASLVGTTSDNGDIGGLYSSIGGTGGTGAITGADVTKLDGVEGVDFVLAVGARILVKDQIDAKQNGIYVVTSIAGSPAVTTMDIERAPDFDSDSEIRAGNYTVIKAGLTQAGQGWVLTDIHPLDDIILNVHDIIWTLVSSAASYLGDPNTIDISLANVISVIPASSGGQVDALQWNSNTITLVGSPQTGEVLIYNNTASTWENGKVIGDLVVVSTPTSDTIISSKDLFALNLNSTTGIAISNTPPTPDSGFYIQGIVPTTTIYVKNPPDTNGDGFAISEDGTMAWWLDGGSGTTKTVHQRTLTIPYDISSAGTATNITITSNSANGGAMNRFSPDGMKMFLMIIAPSGEGHVMEEFALSSPYDVSTATYTATSIPLYEASDWGGYQPYFSPDGTRIYAGADQGFGSQKINEYALSTPWDVTTITYVNSINISANTQYSDPVSVSVNNDGTEIYTMQMDTDFFNPYIDTYSLSTPYDITTAVFSSQFIIPDGITARWLSWDTTGTRLYLIGDDIIVQYDTSAGDGVIGSTFSALYYNGISALKTTQAGVEVTGILSFAAEGSPPTAPQIALPNYTTATLPLTTIEGGTVYDSTTKTLTFYDGTAWQQVTTGQHISNLTDLSDVTIAGSPPGIALATGQHLEYDGVQWVNAVPVSQINDLSDVVVGSPPTNADVLTYNGSNWVNAQPIAQKPLYEKIILAGSPVSQILNTAVSTTATAGSPIATASLQVFRNGMMQAEDLVAGSPIAADFAVTGANQLTFAAGTLQLGDTIIIYVFN